jgi:hypothetical protein
VAHEKLVKVWLKMPRLSTMTNYSQQVIDASAARQKKLLRRPPPLPSARRDWL